MPIYEYRCEACSAISEHFLRSRSEREPEACKRCGSGPLARLISRSAFHLKGEGWYTTDYKATASTKAAPGESAVAAATSSDASAASPGAAASSGASASGGGGDDSSNSRTATSGGAQSAA